MSRNPPKIRVLPQDELFSIVTGSNEEDDPYAQLSAYVGSREEIANAAKAHSGAQGIDSLILRSKAKKVAYIAWLETVERQKGIGRGILEAALDRLFKEGARECYLLAAPDRTKITLNDLTRFYASVGFQHWHDDPCIMMCKLPWKKVEEPVEDNPATLSIDTDDLDLNAANYDVLLREIAAAVPKMPGAPFEADIGTSGAKVFASRDTKTGRQRWRLTHFDSRKRPTGHVEYNKYLELVGDLAAQGMHDPSSIKKSGWSFNPVAPRTDAGSLFRSVSPWEMAEILRTGVIEGRSGWFSGDPRRSHTKLWFSEKLVDAAHNGEDWQRYVESSEPFTSLSEQATRLELIANAARKQKPRASYPPTPIDKLRHDAEDLSRKLREKRREQVLKVFDSFPTQRAAMKATSYVIEMFDLPGGTRYTEGDSLSLGSEVGFAENASYADASTVYLVHTVDRGAPSQEQTREEAIDEIRRWKVVDSVNPQDVQVELPKIPGKPVIAVDNLVQKHEPKVQAIEERAARLLSFQLERRS